MNSKNSGNLFIISAPSGAGKTSLVKELFKKNNSLVISISHTTRQPRKNEIDGEDYFFVTNETFNNFIKKYGCPDIFVNCSYPTTKDWAQSTFQKNST